MFNGIIAFFLTIGCLIGGIFNPGLHYDYDKNVPCENTVRIMSYNVKDEVVGKESIAKRDEYVCGDIAENLPDTFGVQEANIIWLVKLKDMLDNKYDYVGKCRDNFVGEFNAIFYLKDKYNVIDDGTFWLSDKPNRVGSKFKGSNYIRICTWAVFENKETGKRFAQVNSHLDQATEEIKGKQAQMVVDKVNELSVLYPTVLTGDFYTYEGRENYQILSSQMRDARYAATDSTDNKSTYRGWNRSNKDKAKSSPDFIFVKNDNINVLNFKVIDNIRDNVYPSDHCALYADVVFEG